MSAFSNGTEFDAWQKAWCATCANDSNENCSTVIELLISGESLDVGRGPFWSPQTVAYCKRYEHRTEAKL